MKIRGKELHEKTEFGQTVYMIDGPGQSPREGLCETGEIVQKIQDKWGYNLAIFTGKFENGAPVYVYCSMLKDRKTEKGTGFYADLTIDEDDYMQEAEAIKHPVTDKTMFYSDEF